MAVIICRRCGKVVSGVFANQRYCPPCREIVTAETSARSAAKRAAKPKVQVAKPKDMPAPEENICKKPDCYYYGYSTRTCDYRLFTGTGRGAPASECGKYRKRESRRTGVDTAMTNDWCIGTENSEKGEYYG